MAPHLSAQIIQFILTNEWNPHETVLKTNADNLTWETHSCKKNIPDNHMIIRPYKQL